MLRTITVANPNEPPNEQWERAFDRAHDLISETVDKRLVGLDRTAVLNALFAVAENIFTKPGRTHADFADLLQDLARAEREVGLDRAETTERDECRE